MASSKLIKHQADCKVRLIFCFRDKLILLTLPAKSLALLRCHKKYLVLQETRLVAYSSGSKASIGTNTIGSPGGCHLKVKALPPPSW